MESFIIIILLFFIMIALSIFAMLYVARSEQSDNSPLPFCINFESKTEEIVNDTKRLQEEKRKLEEHSKLLLEEIKKLESARKFLS
jgi:hypothetical protein